MGETEISENRDLNQSHGWRDFFIGVLVMIIFIVLAIWLAGDSWSPETGNSNSVGNCIAGTDSGAGC